MACTISQLSNFFSPCSTAVVLLSPRQNRTSVQAANTCLRSNQHANSLIPLRSRVSSNDSSFSTSRLGDWRKQQHIHSSVNFTFCVSNYCSAAVTAVKRELADTSATNCPFSLCYCYREAYRDTASSPPRNLFFFVLPRSPY